MQTKASDCNVTPGHVLIALGDALSIAAERQPGGTDDPDAGQNATTAPSVDPQPRQGTKVSQKKVDQVKVCQQFYSSRQTMTVTINCQGPKQVTGCSCTCLMLPQLVGTDCITPCAC